jgi:polar amino acid transport system permease protein
VTTTSNHAPPRSEVPPRVAEHPVVVAGLEERYPDVATRKVLPQRRPWRWVATAIVLVLLAQALHGLYTNPFYQWDRFRYWFLRPVILQGLELTLEVAAYSAVLGFLGGVVLAACRLSNNRVLRTVSWAYIWLFRSVPLIVVLLFVNNLSAIYPNLGIGVPFGAEFAHAKTIDLLSYQAIAVIGLSLNEAAYAAEVVRGGILSVDQGQQEAANALGIPRLRQLRRIVLPQALRSIVPNYVNQLIGLLKGTSLIYYVSLLDLFGQVNQLKSTYSGDIIPLLMVATVWYIVLTSVLSIAQYYIERRYSRGALRTVAATPLQRLRLRLRAPAVSNDELGGLQR